MRVEDDFCAWNPRHFGENKYQCEKNGQLTIFFDVSDEPPDPCDFKDLREYETAWRLWEQMHPYLC